MKWTGNRVVSGSVDSANAAQKNKPLGRCPFCALDDIACSIDVHGILIARAVELTCPHE
jgi:hypothetical protein